VLQKGQKYVLEMKEKCGMHVMKFMWCTIERSLGGMGIGVGKIRPSRQIRTAQPHPTLVFKDIMLKLK
jgi:hypothetical protein